MKKINKDAGFTAEQRKLVQTELNQKRLIINRGEFKKTPEEKIRLNLEKSKWKKSLN